MGELSGDAECGAIVPKQAFSSCDVKHERMVGDIWLCSRHAILAVGRWSVVLRLLARIVCANIEDYKVSGEMDLVYLLYVTINSSTGET